MDSGKRTRDDDNNNDDDRAVKALITSKDAQLATTLSHTSAARDMEAYYERERRAGVASPWVSASLDRLPADVRKLVASVSVGVLMLLGQTSRAFADIARNDSVWQSCFARDFPREWRFSGGRLPFFVLHAGHPFYWDGIIPKGEESPWKRYYLNMALTYYIYTKRHSEHFHFGIGVFPRTRRIWEETIPLLADDANAKQRYQWCERVLLGGHQPRWDWRGNLFAVWATTLTLRVFTRCLWATHMTLSRWCGVTCETIPSAIGCASI